MTHSCNIIRLYLTVGELVFMKNPSFGAVLFARVFKEANYTWNRMERLGNQIVQCGIKSNISDSIFFIFIDGVCCKLVPVE